MKNITRISAIVIMAVFFTDCSKVPVTDRTQLNLLPESQLAGMALEQYNQVMRESDVVPASDPQAQLVQNVGMKITNGVEQYMSQKGMKNRVSDYKWEFKLIRENVANAWAMPGGKVAIYTGILPITKTEAGLATVMGHEVAHAVARHGNERMSQMMVAQLGGVALDVALSEKTQQTRQIFNTAYAVGAQVGVLLPYSRLQESEADKLGLIFMAVAGYDPRESTAFWQRMQAESGGAKMPEFLSTHPSHGTRQETLQKFMPEALKYYKK
jgi:predicted Zn-dependent protease